MVENILDLALKGELPIQVAFRRYIRARRGEFPLMAENYLRGVTRATGLGREQVSKSRPFREFLKRLE